MLLALIPPRLHAWLDELVALTYVLGAVLLDLAGAALAVALAGAAVHFTLTRLTDYPRGTWKVISFRAHAFVELAEGIGVLLATVFLGAAPPLVLAFLLVLGTSQLGAFAFSDYRWPPVVSSARS
jgi:hypothetical protein